MIIGDFLTNDTAEHMKETFLEMGFRSVKVIQNHDEPQTLSEHTIEEVACEVIRGEWGKSCEKILRLEEAGYDSSAVLSLADEIRKK